MTDTNDEWITTQVGLKKWWILRKEGERIFILEKAVQNLSSKRNINRTKLKWLYAQLILLTKSSPLRFHYAERTDSTIFIVMILRTVCTGFLEALTTASDIESRRYKDILFIYSIPGINIFKTLTIYKTILITNSGFCKKVFKLVTCPNSGFTENKVYIKFSDW